MDSSPRSGRPQFLTIAIQTHALDLELSRRESQMSALVRLITVQQSTGHPRTPGIEGALPVAVDARERTAFLHRLERDDKSLARHEIILRTGLNDQAAVAGD